MANARQKPRRSAKSATVLKQRVAELERERELLNSIANNAPSLLCLIDVDGRVRPFATNKAFERTLGYEPHETGGQLFWDRYVPDGERAAARDCILSAIRSKSSSECEGRWLQRDGTPIEVAKDVLGHTSLATTTVYVATEEKRRMRALAAFWDRSQRRS